MRDDFTEFHRHALDEVTAFLGESFTYNGKSYIGIINAVTLSDELKEGGLLEELGVQIIVSKTQLCYAPSAGQTLYIGTQKARIIKVSSDEVSYELVLITANV